MHVPSGQPRDRSSHADPLAPPRAAPYWLGVVILRWLIPIVAALALTGQAVAAWAAAGVIGEAACCCPSPDRCKCHDHDGSSSQAELRRCAGDAELVAPAPLAAVPPEAPAVAREVAVPSAAPPAPPVLPVHLLDPPEKPPF